MLIVDDDRVSRRFLELSLSQSNQYEVEVAQDVAGALDILATTVIHVILSDIKMPEQDGFFLLRRIRREPRWQNIPMFFVSSDTHVHTKVAAFHEGLDDYITKPIVVPELIGRIGAAINRGRRLTGRMMTRRYELAGNFVGLPFSELVTILLNGNRTGKLAVLTPNGQGEVYFRAGSVCHATFVNVEGEEAFYQFFAEPAGQFEFFPEDALLGSIPQTIDGSSTRLLLEAARRHDDARRDGLTTVATPRAAAAAVKADPQRILPDQTLTAELARVIEDPFALGEFMLLTPDELKARGSVAPTRNSVGVLLFADVDIGMTALSGMASPLSDDQLTKILRVACSGVELCFDCANGRTLTILLGGAAYSALIGAARCAIFVVAPSGGDWMSFSIDERVSVGEYIRTRQPALVLGLGNGGLFDALLNLVRQNQASATALEFIDGKLDDPSLNLREVVGAALLALGSNSTPTQATR